jgi:octaprenyl-diphosphate synthase
MVSGKATMETAPKVVLAVKASGLARRSAEASTFGDAIARLRTHCADSLLRVDDEILNALDSPVKLIPELAGHLIKSGGKRLRPLLTLAAADIFGHRGGEQIRLAAAVELIHGATLLHDDVVDESLLRRGASTANVIWGNKESVLVGDYVFSRAFELMVAVGDLRVLQILSRASGVIAEGEVMQLATQKNLEATFEMYLAVVESKTAALFAAATQAGALVAGADADQEEALRNYGRYLGIAYQLVDDALDYSGREAALGKSVGDDFREGKMTLPVVYAIGRADTKERDFWRRTIADGNQHADDFQEAVRIIDGRGALEDTFVCARRYATRAMEALEAVPSGESSDILLQLAEQSVERAF